MTTLESDKGAFERVCGRPADACKRAGHAITEEKAAVGFYEPVRARKYLDGNLSTFLPRAEYESKEQERKEAQKLALKAVASKKVVGHQGSPMGFRGD